MREYGVTIRSIRLAKGMNQKELYEGIISKSYSIQFEKGLHDLSIDLFNEVLSRLSLTFDEYFFLFNGNRESDYANFKSIFGKAANNNDLPQLESLKSEIEKRSDNETNRLYLSLIEGKEAVIKHFLLTQEMDYHIVPEHVTTHIMKYLMDKQSWTLFELSVFTNSIDYFSTEQRLMLWKNLDKMLVSYQEYDRGRDTLRILLANFIDILLKEENLDLAERLLNALQEINFDLNSALFRIVEMFFRGILLILRESSEQGKQQASMALSILDNLDFKPIADVYRSDWSSWIE